MSDKNLKYCIILKRQYTSDITFQMTIKNYDQGLHFLFKTIKAVGRLIDER